MTKAIVISVVCGMLAGYFVLPGWFIAISGNLLVAGLCVLLFLVGLDLGMEGTVVKNFKKAGWRVLTFPFAIMIGTYAGSLVAGLVLPAIGIRDALAIGSGFGWYSLAPVMLADYSTSVSAISFMHNVMRELFGILLIPIVAKKVGYIETISLPGSASMDVCLPIVEKATCADIAVYSFISGIVLSLAVPITVGLIAGV